MARQLAPVLAAYLYETIRHGLHDRFVPTAYGNLAVGLLVLAISFGFSHTIFSYVERLQAHAVAQGRKAAALSATLAERERISRELHDGLAQILASILMDLDTVSHLIGADLRPAALAEVERLRTQADELYADVRDAVSELRADVAGRGLPAALQEQAAAFEERHGISATLSTVRATPIPPDVASHLFRIVQESLANIRKHSGASHAWVSVIVRDDRSVELEVADDGRGFDQAADRRRGAFGLMTMRERAESLGGSIEVGPRPGGGTRVMVHLPPGSGRSIPDA